MCVEKLDCKLFIDINCNWSSNIEGKDIENCVVIQTKENYEIDYSSIIEETNCVNFFKPNDDQQKCCLLINCKPGYLINNITVCSEAKTIEFFGKNNEYISTHNIDSSQEIRGFNVHSIKTNNLNSCSLSLERLENVDFIWIYGIFVQVLKTEAYSFNSIGPINLQNVQDMLNPNMLATNASKLLSSLSIKNSPNVKNDVLNSFLINMKHTQTPFSNNCCQSLQNGFERLEKQVQDKLCHLEQKINLISNNIEMLNRKFDDLLIILNKNV
ncbi:uncharacterized protein LOC126908475 [Daktulosphaira vitifoliae]|uniref:uncharacterized protein LOC126908475 n=1 Tax=Daktulosphaira vitifoliae TaxID=58002 RepID=UPI0021AA029F|nr:uncharacterized protein LOC126908475 [Daktulosphaira vitifoliae]